MFDFDEILYSKILKIIQRRRRKEDPELIKRQVLLSEISPRLILIARALTGENISIYPAKKEGGYRDLLFFLPTEFSRYRDLKQNINFYIFRIFYLVIQFELDHQFPVHDSHNYQAALDQSVSMSKGVLNRLFEEYPKLNDYYNDLIKEEEIIAESSKKKIDHSYLFGKWMTKTNSFKDKTASKEQNGSKVDSNDITTEIDAQPIEEMETLAVDKKAQEDFMLTHNFEKVETAEEFNGVWRSFDGSDELSDQAEALSALDLKYTVRADETVHSVYKAELAPKSNQIESLIDDHSTDYYSYDEWDYKTRQYKADYCRVFCSDLKTSQLNYRSTILKENQRTILDLRKVFARVHNQLELVHRSTFGDDIDFDAAIDAHADIFAKRSPSERLYIAKAKKRKDLSVLILVDTSLSADSYTEGRQILDIEKQALICFGHVLDEYGIEFQIDSFNSRTRNYCNYYHVKRFNEVWTKTADKIGALIADSYTRIGPALRHAGQEIKKSSYDKKWIILLTDGKASDYDRYEGKPGIEDTKKAIDELGNLGIHTFALAVENRAKYYLPQMFGHRNFEVLPQVDHLPYVLGEFYSKVVMD